jgi:valyl-tRNA synthetase
MIDYESAKFTLDDDVQKQVMDAFIILYNDGFIEKGPRIVN